jgi:hypothetical protein
VSDPETDIKKDFILSQKLLMSRMKFLYHTPMFKKQEDNLAKQSELLSELDITVQCQIPIFKWLIRYLTDSEKPVLDPKIVSSVLVSADSLIMKDVVEECLNYIKQNLEEIVELSCSDHK